MQACLFQHILLLQISSKNKSPLYSETLTAPFNFLFFKIKYKIIVKNTNQSALLLLEYS